MSKNTITLIMAALGYTPIRESNRSALYDTHLGLVRIDKIYNRWVLLSDTSQAGRITSLVARLKGVPHDIANIWIFDTLVTAPPTAAELKKRATTPPSTRVVRCGEITSANLLKRLRREGIPEDVARLYCQEVSFCNIDKGTTGYGFGIKNRIGGYNLITSRGASIFVGWADICIIHRENLDYQRQCSIFVGLLDALSYLSESKDIDEDIIVMSSSSLAGKLPDVLVPYDIVRLYAPNTPAKQLINEAVPELTDMSPLYDNFRNYHEWYLHRLGIKS